MVFPPELPTTTRGASPSSVPGAAAASFFHSSLARSDDEKAPSCTPQPPAIVSGAGGFSGCVEPAAAVPGSGRADAAGAAAAPGPALVAPGAPPAKLSTRVCASFAHFPAGY